MGRLHVCSCVALALGSLPYDVIAATALTEALSNRAWYLKRAALSMDCDDADGEETYRAHTKALATMAATEANP